MNPRVAPYGTWNSPITPEMFTSRFVALSQLRVDGPDIYWVESHPKREQRNVLLRRSALGHTTEVLPLLEGSRLVHVATRVHEYGGRAYAVKHGLLIVSDGIDDRVYRFSLDDPRGELIPLTPMDKRRYGDFEIDEVRGLVYAVCEDHTDPGNITNTLVAIPIDGSAAREGTRIITVFEGTDFVAAPTLSLDGTKLAWLTWNHPEMPWTHSALHVGALDFDGYLDHSIVLVDKPDVCVYEPRWTLDGDLIHVDDSTGWANLYRTEGFEWRDGEPHDAWATRLRTRALHPASQAFSQPHWQLGLHSYDNLDRENLICSWADQGRWHIGTVRLDNGLLEEWDTGWSPVGNVTASEGRVVYLAQTAHDAPAIVTVEGSSVKAVRPSTDLELDPEVISIANAVSWPTRDGAVSHGFFYPPSNPAFQGPEGARPPLIVTVHGGPTGAAHPGLNIEIQFWTSRGFAVLDVNHRGSTGFGRDYREALNGKLGILDVTDCADGVVWLGKEGAINLDRVAIRGASSGGFTALSALATTDIFSAGTALYGMSDLRVVASLASKFRSHYLERLLQTADSSDEIWTERSPLFHVHNINVPVLLLQGTNDPIVPLSQTQHIFDELASAGKEVALVTFEGEGHGFVRPESIIRARRVELSFYAQVWGIDIDDPAEIDIANQQ